MLASALNPQKFEVNIYERNPALGRKFLVAGQGGFNLTHSESPDAFIKRYTPSAFLESAFFSFNNKDLQNWLAAIGISTFVGTSGRVFPIKGIKPIQVLDAFLKRLEQGGVNIYTSMEWTGFSEQGDLLFKSKTGNQVVKSDITVFCLGGASWPKTGSKGDWTNHFLAKGIRINPFQASNCAFKIQWPTEVVAKLQGMVLKNCVFSCGNRSHAGEAVLTSFGIEGSGTYPLSPEIRKGLESAHEVELKVDFKPNLSMESLIEKLNSNKTKGSYSKRIQTALHLSNTHLILLKHSLSKEDFLDAARLSFFIKQFPLRICDTGPIDEAISTVGGLALKEINEHFELKKIKNTYAIGEMLDFDAPTGGYLLQSCFSMGHALAQYLNNHS